MLKLISYTQRTLLAGEDTEILEGEVVMLARGEILTIPTSYGGRLRYVAADHCLRQEMLIARDKCGEVAGSWIHGMQV